jgi:Immunoglobulin-like domain of bacterial spore germination
MKKAHNEDMKYLDYALVGLIIIATLGAVFVYTLNQKNDEAPYACTMDAMICPDGTALGRTGPDCTFPSCSTPDVPGDIQAQIDAKKDRIMLSSPAPLTQISSPVTLQGMARGYWFFEGSFPITVVNWDGLIIGEGFATAQGEWMTENFVPFTATVDFIFDPETPYNRGALILQRDNPSGLPENDDALEIPITF